MMDFKRGSHLTTLIAVVAGLVLAPIAFADDADDILAVVKQYGDLENDLAAQARMMRSDRVYIAGGMRQTDEAKNMAIQMAGRAASEAVNGGKTTFNTIIEGPLIRVYGNVAVASFVRAFQVIPHNQPATPGQPLWVTLVLVKDGGQWGIAHTHQSSTSGN